MKQRHEPSHNEEALSDHKTRTSLNSKQRTRFLFILGILSMLAFTSGYLIDPGYIRILWLLISGTLVIICAIMIYMSAQKLV